MERQEHEQRPAHPGLMKRAQAQRPLKTLVNFRALTVL